MVGKYFLKNKYKVITKLGFGQFGVVYLVETMYTKIKQSVKVINGLQGETLKSSIEEFELLKQLDNQNVVKFTECFEEEFQFCIVSEFCEDGDLANKIQTCLKKNIIIEDTILIKWAHQMLNGLSYIHSKDIIHRNLKPSNIFIQNNVIKIGDIGLSKIVVGESLLKFLPETFYYMSPEFIKEEVNTKSSDVWSIGCIIYETISLKIPFSGKNPADVINAIINNTMPKLTRLTILQPIITMSLQKMPTDRAQSKDLFEKISQTKAIMVDEFDF